MTVAVLFIGNSGSGKSTLLSQFGSEFAAGVRFRKGYTKEIDERWATINGENVLLMDVPGLYEPNSAETEKNAQILNAALSKGYDYKIFFVLKANNRGPGNDELVLISKVNECVRQSGCRVLYGLIINQIPDQDTYDMYEESLARDNCREVFSGLVIEQYSFNVMISSVHLLWFDRIAIKNGGLRRQLEEAIARQHAVPMTNAPGKKVAILFLGNSGAGKSTLLSQIGGEFPSGVRFRRGLTKGIEEQIVKINGQDVILMDVPGLFEPDSKETEKNAEKLNEALSRGYDYKLYFVLKASNRGPDNAEMVFMSKINNCVRQAGQKAIYRVIVNQIPDKDVHNMYQKHLANDNCKELFGQLDIEGYSFDIRISSVLLLPFDKNAIMGGGLRRLLEKDIKQHSARPVFLKEKIVASNVDLKKYALAVAGCLAIAASTYGVGLAVEYAIGAGFGAFGLLSALLK
ncbi:hypothetical protein BGZ49_008093 [Haplosporangium sp. Z 27]|nr:hypothetical protein BGZ49_008093 [Haplosporangium sp. Z 27]